MIPAKFSRDRCEKLLSSIANGNDISAPVSGWTGNDLLALAGACLAAATTHGPAAFALNPVAVDSPHFEHKEFVSEQFNHDLHATIDWYADLAFAVLDAKYDYQYEPNVTCLVSQTGTLYRELRPVQGFKHR